MTVFGNPARGADVADRPRVRVPGGVMTDAGVGRVVGTRTR